MAEKSKHTPDPNQEWTPEKEARRRSLHLESRQREKEVLSRLLAELGIDLPRISNLRYPDPFKIEGGLLSFLLRELEASSTDAVMGDLCDVLFLAPISRLPVQPCIEAYSRGGHWTRLSIENKLQRKKWHAMGDWIVKSASEAKGEPRELWQFDALAKQVEPDVAERIIRNRFWEHPGYAAQALAKIGKENTIGFLKRSLEECYTHELPTFAELKIHREKIERAINAIRNRLAKKLLRRSGLIVNRPRGSVSKSPVERPFQDARITNVTTHCLIPTKISDGGELDLHPDVEHAVRAVERLKKEIHSGFTGYYSKDVDIIEPGFWIMMPEDMITNDYEFGLPRFHEKEFGVGLGIGVFYENWSGKPEEEMFACFLDMYLEALHRIIEYLKQKGKDIDEAALRADMAKFREALRPR